jgi:hypothetical protein
MVCDMCFLVFWGSLTSFFILVIRESNLSLNSKLGLRFGIGIGIDIGPDPLDPLLVVVRFKLRLYDDSADLYVWVWVLFSLSVNELGPGNFGRSGLNSRDYRFCVLFLTFGL